MLKSELKNSCDIAKPAVFWVVLLVEKKIEFVCCVHLFCDRTIYVCAPYVGLAITVLWFSFSILASVAYFCYASIPYFIPVLISDIMMHCLSLYLANYPYLCVVRCMFWIKLSIYDEKPRAKGPTTRAMARRIQEECALNAHARPKMNFTWAKEDVKT